MFRCAVFYEVDDSVPYSHSLMWKNMVRVVEICERIVRGVKKIKEEVDRTGKTGLVFYERTKQVIRELEKEAYGANGGDTPTGDQLVDLFKSEVGHKILGRVNAATIPDISRIFRPATLLAPRNLDSALEDGQTLVESSLFIHQKQIGKWSGYFNGDGFLCGVTFWAGEVAMSVGVKDGEAHAQEAVIPYESEDTSESNASKLREMKGFIVAFNALSEDILSGKLEKRIECDGKKFGIVGLKVLCSCFSVTDTGLLPILDGRNI